METDYKMDPELKQKWVDALRSGKYKQGEGLLRDKNDHYCCLGVLADVMGMEWCYIRGRHSVEGSFTTELPSEILPLNFQGQLIEMNDGMGVPRRRFKTIAKWIEKNL